MNAHEPKAWILSQGDEVVTGQVVDTNAAWLAERLTAMGFDVWRHVAAGDRLADLEELLRESAGKAEVVLSTGGLGPTQDDLTAEAVSRAFSRPLERDPGAVSRISGYFERLGRTMTDANLKQADLPAGSTRLDNEVGTAPGFQLVEQGTWYAFLPGVPREMTRMFEEHVAPALLARFELRPRRLVTLRAVGLGESLIQQRLGRIADERFVISYRTRLPENHVKLRFRDGVTPDEVAEVVAGLRGRIGTSVFAVDGLGEEQGELADVVGAMLHARGETLAVAEVVSAGQLSLLCAEARNAEEWFREGVVVTTRGARARLLGPNGVSLDTLTDPSERAIALAQAVLRSTGSTWGLAVGEPRDREDGNGAEVTVALSGAEGNEARDLRLVHRRDRQAMLSAAAALDLLRRHLAKRD